MLIGTQHKLFVSQPLSISLNNVLIESVLSYNYLGVVFESELSMDLHLTKVHDRVQCKLFHLRKIRKYLKEFASLKYTSKQSYHCWITVVSWL